MWLQGGVNSHLPGLGALGEGVQYVCVGILRRAPLGQWEQRGQKHRQTSVRKVMCVCVCGGVSVSICRERGEK